MERAEAWQIVLDHVEQSGLVRHMQAVEAAMRWYAQTLDEDPALWGLAGLLHDYDWEIHPTLEGHPALGAPLLRGRGCPEVVIKAILAHNPAGTGVEPEHPIDFGLRACDEITGLIAAAARVHPSKDLREVRLSSLKRRFKEGAFARGVDREEVARATEDFSRVCFGGSLDLWQHTENVLRAMQEVASELELDGRLAAAPP
jgi:putative nucleotidyltransferase with HDIG domain